MKDSVILEGKIYISAKRAAKIINYAQDYIGQLCRSGKLDCKMIGRSWFVTEESLLSHRADAIDNTQERVLKVVKNNDVVIKKTIKAAVEENKIIESAAQISTQPVASKELVVSPVQVPAPVISPIQTSSFKYETEQKSFLPELKKKVPAEFELPKKANVLKITSAPFVANKIKINKRADTARTQPSPAISSMQTSSTQTFSSSAQHFSTTLAVTLLALGGFFFTLSVASLQNTNKSYSHNQASVASAASDLMSEIMKSLGLMPKSPAPVATANHDTGASNLITPQASTTNGIAIFPSTTSAQDDLAKAQIMNSFSDQVTVQPDQGGTSGVITPVFKKTDGKDFVYVLVPVKDKKE